jgi:hypothetical protein
MSTPHIEQQTLPLSGRYQCETCFVPVPISLTLKSEERYDHTLCFKHQLIFKKQQVRNHRLANRKPS